MTDTEKEKNDKKFSWDKSDDAFDGSLHIRNLVTYDPKIHHGWAGCLDGRSGDPVRYIGEWTYIRTHDNDKVNVNKVENPKHGDEL